MCHTFRTTWGTRKPHISTALLMGGVMAVLPEPGWLRTFPSFFLLTWICSGNMPCGLEPPTPDKGARVSYMDET